MPEGEVPSKISQEISEKYSAFCAELKECEERLAEAKLKKQEISCKITALQMECPHERTIDVPLSDRIIGTIDLRKTCVYCGAKC